MTLAELACLFNFLGVTVLFVISFIVSWRYPAPFFQQWTKVYLGAVVMMAVEFVGVRWGRSLPIDILEIGLIAVVSVFLVKTGRQLRARDTNAVHLAFPVVGLVYGLAVLTAGGTFQLAVLPIALYYSAAHLWLGGQFIAYGRETDSAASARWLSVPLIALGLWLLTYPAFMSLTFLWVGYLVSGLLTVTLGTGMVAFVIEKSAERLRESHAALVELNGLKTNFIRVMSHELRTPLSSINTAAYLMGTGGTEPLSDRQTEYMAIISNNAKVLNRLVTDILDFSRMESGVISYELLPGDLSTVVSESTRSLAGEFASKGILLTYEAPTREVSVSFDHERMTQVVTNLLVNALKFTPAGGAVVTRVAVAADVARIEVADTGVGIPAEEHQRIFEKFHQIDSQSTRKANGLGLGLSIAKSIVEGGHRGRLSVVSTVGAGSTFTIELPLASSGKAPARLEAAKDAAASGGH